MPTFNQLVRKGREQVTYKSTSPAMQKGMNTLKNKETNLSSPQKRGGDQPQLPSEERRLHRGPYLYAQEAELCSA